MNIVTVDNNPAALSQIAEIIAEIVPECQIHSFNDPLFSAKYICNTPVDMVFVADAMQPVNGFRLLQVLRKNIPKLPVVMLLADECNRVDAVQAGVNDYLLKPVSVDRLGGVIKQLAA